MDQIELSDADVGRPRGWYPDPFVPELLRLWDGASWTDLTSPPAVQEADGRLRQYHPLCQGERPHVVRTLVMFTLWSIPAVLVNWALVSWIPEPTYTFEQTLLWNPGVFSLFYFGFLARRVDYRWFDTFFLLVPIYSVIWMVKILWRTAKLPYRNWSPRREVVEADPAWQELNARSSALRLGAASGVIEGDAQRP